MRYPPKLWVVCGVLADWSQGAARAMEAAGLDQNAIVTSVGAEMLPDAWNQGYSGCWMMCDYFTDKDFTKQLVPNLMSVVRGEKQMSELFLQGKTFGQRYGVAEIVGKAATKYNYQTM